MTFCCDDMAVIHICNSAEVFRGGSGRVGHFCASMGEQYNLHHMNWNMLLKGFEKMFFDFSFLD